MNIHASNLNVKPEWWEPKHSADRRDAFRRLIIQEHEELGLTRLVERLAHSLCTHVNYRTGLSYPSLHTLARDCGAHVRSIRRGLAALAKARLMRWHKHGDGNTNSQYRLAFELADAWWDAEQAERKADAEARAETKAASLAARRAKGAVRQARFKELRRDRFNSAVTHTNGETGPKKRVTLHRPVPNNALPSLPRRTNKKFPQGISTSDARAAAGAGAPATRASSPSAKPLAEAAEEANQSGPVHDATVKPGAAETAPIYGETSYPSSDKTALVMMPKPDEPGDHNTILLVDGKLELVSTSELEIHWFKEPWPPANEGVSA
jgi:hypothetical protein